MTTGMVMIEGRSVGGVRKLQEEDPTIGPILSALVRDDKPSKRTESRISKTCSDNYGTSSASKMDCCGDVTIIHKLLHTISSW